jgi:hypothetical protein
MVAMIARIAGALAYFFNIFKSTKSMLRKTMVRSTLASMDRDCYILKPHIELYKTALP